MIAGPHQNDRTLIELYANKMSSDPAASSELFTEGAEVKPGGLAPVKLQGRSQIRTYLAQAQGQLKYKVTSHLPRQGDDNYAEISAEGPGVETRIHTLRFRTDGHFITHLEMVGTRKA